jgi:hypothetical protein
LRSLNAIVRALCWFAVLPAAALAQKPSITCVTCHVQARTQPLTQMATALQPLGANATMNAHPNLTVKKGDYTYTVETRNGKTTYSVTDGRQSVSYPIDWGFGAGNQTWVYQREGRFYESLMSYYTSINGLGTTTGDEALNPHTVEDAAGRLLPPRDIIDCFGCHSTHGVEAGKLHLSSLHAGVDCAQCHQGIASHLDDAIKGRQGAIPADLSAMSTEDISTFCGRCHRTFEKVVRNRAQGEINSRFPAYRIALSRCFDGADPRISCIACHDVHKPLEQADSFYDARCLACHSAQVSTASNKSASGKSAAANKPGALAPPADAKICPVAKSNCTSCHMPKVKLPGGLLNFTDHQIRVVRPGEPYPN